MQLKDGFILRTVAGEHVVVPSGEDLNLNMMITLNETGKLLWEELSQGAEEETLVALLLQEYDVEERTAREHVARFIGKMRENGFLK